MPVKLSVIQDLRSRLKPLIDSQAATIANQALLFKVYVFALVLNAASREDALPVSYRDSPDLPSQALRFRAKPGVIHASTPYSHALIQFPNKPTLEAHLSLQVQGRSKVLHDCDIVVLYQHEAQMCRALCREPRSSKVVMAIKCGFSAPEVDLQLARAFLGQDLDLRIEGDSYFVSNSVSAAAAKLLAYHRKKWELSVVPASTNNITRLLSLFQTTFHNFKARS